MRKGTNPPNPPGDGSIDVTVVPSQVAVSSGFQAFDEDGLLSDDNQARMLKTTVDEFVKLL